MSRAAVTERRREKARCWRSATRRAAVGPLPSSSKEQRRTTLGLTETEVEWREVEGEQFALPFVPPLLSHSAATAGSHCCASPSKVESHDGAPFVLLWSLPRRGAVFHAAVAIDPRPPPRGFRRRRSSAIVCVLRRHCLIGVFAAVDTVIGVARSQFWSCP
ncbi:uncharacterized protein LOC127741442 [Arachis duranensis]|uniref:Uncharacterized protein LOC127741442 n=1 Tax=Arachis duranensis TaxID=130453 RepID=A0A9C6WPS7_ARADU|nr:uncharacterized protein LOC127741442 [Arachis duranensis]